MTPGPLWEATRDLHHACEAHAVGGAMASGNPPRSWYAAWLSGLLQIHNAIDQHLPESVHRVAKLRADIEAMSSTSTAAYGPPLAARTYAASLTTEPKIAGAAYVLTGAHLMGGEIMRRRLAGFPTAHLTWDDRKAALAVLGQYRSRTDITTEARACFVALLSIMDEISA